MRRKKKNHIWKDAWSYLKESRNYVYFAIVLFILGILAGYLFPGFFGDYFDPIIRDLISKTEGLDTGGLIGFIFWNNLTSAFLAFVLGVLLGIFPGASVLLNGTLLGYVLEKSVEIEGIVTLWRLVPHGIFELPAIFIAVGIGMRLGMFWFVKGKKLEVFRHRLWEGLKVFVAIVIPLLVLAAIIEGFLIGLG